MLPPWVGHMLLPNFDISAEASAEEELKKEIRIANGQYLKKTEQWHVRSAAMAVIGESERKAGHTGIVPSGVRLRPVRRLLPPGPAT